jgi:uncharacterized membrane protein (UPF0127 family)
MGWHKTISKKNKIWIACFGLFFLLNLTFIFTVISKSNAKTKLSVNNYLNGEFKSVSLDNHLIKAELATSPDSQYLGLSNRDSLCSNCGMLFIFPEKDEQDFVMRDMKFPLDIVFLSDNSIINIEQQLPPEGNDPINIYKSIAPADKVLELPGGYCENNGIKVGDKLIINDK